MAPRGCPARRPQPCCGWIRPLRQQWGRTVRVPGRSLSHGELLKDTCRQHVLDYQGLSLAGSGASPTPAARGRSRLAAARGGEERPSTCRPHACASLPRWPLRGTGTKPANQPFTSCSPSETKSRCPTPCLDPARLSGDCTEQPKRPRPPGVRLEQQGNPGPRGCDHSRQQCGDLGLHVCHETRQPWCSSGQGAQHPPAPPGPPRAARPAAPRTARAGARRAVITAPSGGAVKESNEGIQGRSRCRNYYNQRLSQRLQMQPITLKGKARKKTN